MDDAGHAAPRARLQREHRPAAALGDEVLLEMLTHPRGARQSPQLLDRAVLALAQLLAQAAQKRRGTVAQVRSVLLHAAPDLARERCELRVDRRRQLPEEGNPLRLRLDRGARSEPAGDRGGDPRQCIWPERAAAAGERGCVADVVDALERRLGGAVEQRNRLRGQRLPPRHLAGVRRRHEGARELRPVRGARRGDEPLDDRGVLDGVEGVYVHAASVRAASGSRAVPKKGAPVA